MWNWKCKFDPKDFAYGYVYEELHGVIVQSVIIYSFVVKGHDYKASYIEFTLPCHQTIVCL